MDSTVSRALWWVSLVLLLSVGVATVTAQSPDAPSEEVQVADPAAGQRPQLAPLSNRVQVSVYRTGVSVYDRGEWAVLGLRGNNPLEKDVEATVVLFFEQNMQTRYERRFWIPARSTRMTWLPVRVPNTTPHPRQLKAYTMNLVASDGEDVLQRGSDPSLYSMSLLPINNMTSLSGAIHQRRDPRRVMDESWPDEDAADVLGVMREAAEADSASVSFRDMFLPPYPHALDGLDHLLISDDRWLSDSAAPLALRSWLQRGGSAWLMLEYVGQDAVDALLGDDSCLQIVDRVELTEFTLRTPQLSETDRDPEERWVSERPVEFIRVLLTEDAVVHSWIGEWPAAFSIKQGNGEVLVTTLGARGWHHRLALLEDPPAANVPSDGPTQALGELGARMLATAPEASLPTKDIQAVLQSQIGYDVPKRATIGLILGVNFTALLVAGLVFARWQRLQHLAWFLPLCAVATASAMIGLGKANVSQVTPTLATVQLMELSSASEQVHATTYAAFYSPSSERFSLSSSAAGLVTPQDDADGGIRQIAWKGGRNSYWKEFRVPPGAARFVKLQDDYMLSQQIRAVGRFGPEGLAGRIDNVELMGEPSDAVLATPVSANSGMEFRDGGQFVCGDRHLLSPNEYLSGVLLTDRQQRRQTIYRSLFDAEVTYPTRPTVFVWGDAERLRMEVPEVFEARGETLWAIPLQWERTPSGGAFSISPTFLKMVNAADATLGTSNVYNPRTGVWLDEVSAPTRSFFEFLLPPVVLPAELTSATVQLKINAPWREVQVLGKQATTGKVVVIKSWQGPSGLLELQIADPELLKTSASGGLLLGLSVGEASGSATSQREQGAPVDKLGVWQVEYMHVSVSGKTL